MTKRVELLLSTLIAMPIMCGVFSVLLYFAVESSATARKAARQALKEMPVFLTLLEAAIVIGALIFIADRVVNIFKTIRDAMNEDRTVKAVKAMTTRDSRVSSAAAREIVHALDYAPRWQITDQIMPEMPQLPSPVDSYPVMDFKIGDVSLRNDAHFLFAGQSGSGKTTGLMDVVWQMSQTMKDAEFIVLEPRGVNWKNQANATTTTEIIQYTDHLYDVMDNRLSNLKSIYDVDHANDVGMSKIVVVIEEAESVIREIGSTSPEARQFIVQLQTMAAQGRKANFHLLFATQTAIRRLFDTTIIENIGNQYLFSAMPQLAERMRVSRKVSLPDLSIGQAYDVRRGTVVRFAKRGIPQIAGTYRGIAPKTTQNHNAVRTAWTPPEQVGEAISKETVRRIYEIYQNKGGQSIKGTARVLYPDIQPGGYAFYFVRAVIEHAEDRQLSDSPYQFTFDEETHYANTNHAMHM